MQDFFVLPHETTEICCKSCKIGTPFRDVPQFIPQLMPENPGKSKKSVHFCDLFLLGFHAGMGIKLKCQGYLRMPQNLRERADVHAGFNRSGCERVSEGMDAHLFKSCRFQSAVKGAAKIAALIGCTDVRTEHKVIGIPRGPLGQASFQLNDPLGGEQFLHLFGERDGSPPGSCFRRTCLQASAGLCVIREVTVPPDGLLDREAATVDV